MAENKKKNKWDIRKIVLAILIAAVVIGVLTGKISLGDLFGQGQVPAVTESAAAVTESPQTQASTQAQTKASEKETTRAESTAAAETTAKKDDKYVSYKFRNKARLDEHYEKHGKEMGFASAKEYEKAASDIINDASVMHKYKSDGSGDQCFFVKKTNEFVVLSNDGYIRTYFICSGISYYNRQ